MITADWVRMMARYAAWQNAAQIAAVGTLDDAAYTADRSGFFGSIRGTLNHLLWGDRIWMARLAGFEKPQAGSIAASVEETPDFATFARARAAHDAQVADWAASLTDADVAGELSWYSGAAGRDISRPVAVLLTHMFNHGTHHRGQVHEMLTAAGAGPGDTDLFLMPED